MKNGFWGIFHLKGGFSEYQIRYTLNTATQRKAEHNISIDTVIHTFMWNAHWETPQS